ncbi:MAG: TRAP transporter substrate-binding protein [Ramlibacter sp.]|nr:TRAP transporter substrate-binding protein [Ramlibacter sp.]
MELTRRTVLAGAGAGVIGLQAGGAFAQKAEFTYKYANNLPPTHPMNVRAREMASAVRAETRGRVDIQIFPQNQLGSDTEMLALVRSGGIEFFTLSGLILSSVAPAAAITGVGFAFPNYEAVWSALDGELGTYIRAEILAKADLVAMDRIWDNGFRQITSSTKPIRSAEDLGGMKIRVPVSPMWSSMFRALGTVPASINFSEVYAALQAKTVEGQENPLAVIDAAKLYEVQKYCSLTHHMWDGFWFLANRSAWERLPQDLRGIVSKRVNAAATVERIDIAILNAILQKDLANKGMIFNQAAPDSFRGRMRQAGFYAEWKAKFGSQAWATLERYTGKLI